MITISNLKDQHVAILYELTRINTRVLGLEAEHRELTEKLAEAKADQRRLVGKRYSLERSIKVFEVKTQTGLD